ncbi:MAG: MmgE/PrpD family protein [Bacteroidales bacterium]|nr:MmgE/PrpD family protein [Bacteroidales bacterium]
MKQNLTERFIDGLFAKAQAIPERVIRQAKKCLLDYSGVAVGGAKYMQERHPAFFEAFTKEAGECSVFGTEYKTTAANAALLNGFSAHVLELDDGHRKGMIHLGASIISAVLAVAEKDNLSVDRILCGVVMGYDAAVRCARALQPGHKLIGYHVSGTCGTIGSAMGIAFACGYTKEQLKSTLACAVTSAAGVLEIQEEASELKPYNLGRAAMDGLMAARMGRLALPGPDDILGGKRGFLAVLTDTPVPSHLTDFDNEDYSIEGIYQKMYAACRHCHPAIEAAIAIRNDVGITPEQVDRVEVNTYKLAVGGHDHTDIKGISSAKLSTPYSVALGMVKGNAGYEDFNEANLHDPDILELTHKVFVFEDEQLTAQSPAIRGARVVISLKNGEEYENSVLYPKGEPENPIPFKEIEEKTFSLLQEYHHPFVKRIVSEHEY